MRTDGLGLVTLLIAASSAASIGDDAWARAVGGSALQVTLHARSGGREERAERQRFVEGFVSSSLTFCIGPLTVLGALNDGLGNGADQLFLKSALDGFAATAFAASLGWGSGPALRIRQIPVGDLLPALVIAPLFTAAVLAVR